MTELKPSEPSAVSALFRKIIPRKEPKPEQMVTEREYAQLLYRDARTAIADAIPGAVTKEATDIHLERESDADETGSYMGKLHGRHYIYVRTGHFPADHQAFPMPGTEQRLNDTLIVVHELLHQKHAETVGEEALLGYRAQQYAELPENRTKDDHRIFRELAIQSLKTVPPESMTYTVAEGVTQFGSLVVLNTMLDRARKLGKLEEATVIEKRRKSFLNELRDYGRTISVREYFDGPVLIMHNLMDRFGPRELPALIASIDLVACRKIRRGTAEYNRMLADPTKLPGLEKFAANTP